MSGKKSKYQVEVLTRQQVKVNGARVVLEVGVVANPHPDLVKLATPESTTLRLIKLAAKEEKARGEES